MPGDTVTWFHGALAADPALPLGERAVWLGDALYEVALVVDRRPVLLEPHIDRLLDSAAALHVDLPAGFVATLDGALDTLLPAVTPHPAMLRILVTRGPGGPGLDPPTGQQAALILQATALDAAPPPTDAVLLDSPRIDPLDPLSGHLTTSALRWVEARRRARAAGAGVALVPTIAGDVAQADDANLFLRPESGADAGAVVTPPLSRGVRPGVSRAWVMDTLRAQGTLVVERPIEPDELRRAAEVFLSDSLIGVWALRTIDGEALPAPTPTTKRLAAAYAKLAGLRGPSGR